MSGNRDELPEPSFARERQGTRRELNRSRPPSRQRQRSEAERVAEELGINRGGVATTDTLDGGIDAFLRSSGARAFGESVRGDFADEADFVTPGDVNPRIDRRDIAANPVVAEQRRDDVASRARQQTAADARFVKSTDLRADVGPRGVSGLSIPEPRRDDVAARARSGLAAEDRFAKPGDFGVDVGASGIESAGFTDMGARRRASRQFESQTLLDEVDPQSDIERSGDGFALGETPQREIAATRFERETSLSDVDPFGDVTARDGGFGLDMGAQTQIAAGELDEQFGSVDIGTGDVTRTGDGFGLDTDARRRGAARGFEDQLDQFGQGELDPSSDIRSVDDGFGLGRDPAREVAADRIDEQLEDFNVTAESIELEETASGTFEGIFETEVRR